MPFVSALPNPSGRIADGFEERPSPWKAMVGAISAFALDCPRLNDRARSLRVSLSRQTVK